MHEKLLNAFNEGISRNFNDDLAFAFITGSVARQEEQPNSDIDMLVVVKSVDFDGIEKFKKWYMDIHETFAHTPDMDYPGEVVSETNLQRALAAAYREQPVKIISAKDLYDGIVWAGMLISPTIGFMGSKRVFELHREKAFEVCNKWVNELGLKHADSEALDVLLKTHIIYDPCGN